MPPFSAGSSGIGLGLRDTPPQGWRRLLPWAIAVAATIAAVGIRYLLDPLLGDALPLVTLLIATMVTVLLTGYRPALVTATVGFVACITLFVAPRGEFGPWDASLITRAVGFWVACGGIIWLIDGLRSNRLQVIAERRWLRRLLATIDDNFVMIDREWRYVYVNQRTLEDAGLTREELLGKVMWEVFPGLLGTELERAARAAVIDQRPARIDFYYPTRKRWFESRLYPSAEGLTILASDITEQKKAEGSLAKRVAELATLYAFTDRLHRATSLEEVYTAAFDAIHAAFGADRASILLFDASGVMRFVASRDLSDRYRAAVDGLSPWRPGEDHVAPIWVHDVDAAEMEDWRRAEVVKEEIRAFGLIPLIASGTLIGKFMLYHRVPHAPQQEEIDLAVTIARQLAFAVERQRTADERRRAENALLDANQRKDEFLATLAHELRNPLSPVRHMLEVLRQADGDPAMRRQAREVMERQVGHLVRLVDDLLDVGRITQNRLELRREPVALAALVWQAVETCQSLIESLGHDLKVVLPEEAVLVDADPVRLTQVLGNLLNNACKYTPPGGRIGISARVDGDTVVVSVRDSGMGIPAALMPRLFDLFTQADRSLERSQGGLGIGLTLVRRLVEMHGGRVEALSAGPGLGSDFLVYLPVLRGAVRQEPRVTDPAPVVASRRILVVDDNRDGAASLAMILRRAGHDTEIAHDGLEALVTAERFRPELMLLDLGLPHLNGFDTCRRLRSEPWGSDTVVVALTGYGQDDYRKRSVDAGFDGHMVKPVDLAELGSLIAKLGV